MYINTLNAYLKNRFGRKIYKLTLDGGMTCPNRDGKVGFGGCIFCGGNGSGSFCPSVDLSITAQIEEGKKLLKNKIKEGGYIAYFQSHTNTYAAVPYLRKIFYEAVNHPDIVGISIGTRPDCLEDDVLKLLEELAKIKPLWVELGLQTINENTAKLINRCYPLKVYDQAVKNLKSIGAEVVTHVILGLPGESEEQMLETVAYSSKVSDGIKLQLLHVLKDTKLYEMYQKEPFKIFSMEEYTELLCRCIEIIPKNVVIHRMTGDGDKRLLIEPMWSGNKKVVLNYINKAFSEKDIVQGCKAEENNM
ncbi:TIGR01212 family radical SAM protein [Anaeromassilibacillus sp. An172]|uniref:TIGR01212 family radical SAM protein n=1 Tax=Anaeromassilibacillus sp. An172 TaxID=1965570 RepID=UPI000B3AD403|nr:TIGR01212 family radical SAM protein [Anaeromassilibacillus sp. An172]OUP78492.1 TIGR01212 family radical SAM protein [Anaeromassilibacillus sp. An172]